MHSLTTESGAQAFISESAKINTSWPEVRGVTVPHRPEDGVTLDVYIGAASAIEELLTERHIHFKHAGKHGDAETLSIPTKEAAQAIKVLTARNTTLAKAGSNKTAIELAVAAAATAALPH